MTHSVTAALVLAKQEDGSVVYLYQGAQVPASVPKDEVARLVEGELIAVDKADKK